MPGWLVHDRHLGGHGLARLATPLSAWDLRAWPVLSAGVALVAASGALGAWCTLRPSASPAWLAPGVGVVGLALLLASAVPLEQPGHASTVQLGAGWPLAAGVVLAAVVVGIGLAQGARGRAWRLALAGLAGVALVAGVGTRALELDRAAAATRHYADGSYTRAAGDGLPAQTLTIDGGTYRVGDQWTGTLSGEGLVVVLVDDPVCPEARGTYRVFDAGGDDIRWQEIVDVCADGERARHLTTGIWRRGS